jgi:hypothetical protein
VKRFFSWLFSWNYGDPRDKTRSWSDPPETFTDWFMGLFIGVPLVVDSLLALVVFVFYKPRK